MDPVRALLLLSLAAVLPHAVASGCTPSTSQADVDVVGRAYVFDDNDFCRRTDLCIYSYWVYEESNGIPGAQRGDEHVDDTCGGAIAADTVVA